MKSLTVNGEITMDSKEMACHFKSVLYFQLKDNTFDFNLLKISEDVITCLDDQVEDIINSTGDDKSVAEIFLDLSKCFPVL